VRRIHLLLIGLAAWGVGSAACGAEPPGSAKPEPGPLIEDRAAGKLLEAGQARLEAEEPAKAVEIWQSLIEPVSPQPRPLSAHMLLGKHFLERERAYERAGALRIGRRRGEPRRGAAAEALLRTGAAITTCGTTAVLPGDARRDRQVSRQFLRERRLLLHRPGALPARTLQPRNRGPGERGTAVTAEQGKVEKLEAGNGCSSALRTRTSRSSTPAAGSKILCEAASGDREMVKCFLIARNTGWPSVRSPPGWAGDSRQTASWRSRATTSETDVHRSAYGRERDEPQGGTHRGGGGHRLGPHHRRGVQRIAAGAVLARI